MRTIDFGIDLGTTNSAIARQTGITTDVLGPNEELLLPSIIHIDDSNRVTVGCAARARRTNDAVNVTQEFKRLMGTGERIALGGGRTYSPEELSAEVLKALVSRAQNKFGLALEAAVITIPAMFQLPQCEATRAAAAMAGITHAPLLQEPIAAAIASIGSAELRDGYWLVYDLGGGTFDVSLVRSRGGRLQVIDHDGDNHLGGKDFDRVLARHVVGLVRADGRLGAFDRGDALYASTLPLLRAEAERARIALSDVPSATLTVAAPGHDPLFITVDRDELEPLIEPTLERTVRICRAILTRNRMEPGQISRLVLVGGPTHTPYLKAYLADRLGIEARHYVDPTQAVVIGAAIYAATQRVGTPRRTSADVETLTAEIEYEAMTNNPQPLVAGKLIGPRAAGHWQVGAPRDGDRDPQEWSEVCDDGSFALTLRLAENRVNAFELVVQRHGARQALTDGSFVIVHGTTVAKPVLSQSVGVMLSDRTVRWYLRKGIVLPAKMSVSHSTTVKLMRGQSGIAVHVPLVQGENERGDRNTVIGEIRIAAADLTRDLPAGSEVEVRLSVDEHSMTTAEAYIPALDATFSNIVRFGLEAQNGEALLGVLDDQRERLAKLERLAADLEGEESEVDGNVRMIGELIEDGGVDERLQAGEMLRRMAAMIDTMSSHDREGELIAKFQASEELSRQLLHEGDEQIARELDATVNEFYDAIARSDHDLAEARFKAAEAIEWTLLQREPDYWRQLYGWLVPQVAQSPQAAEGSEATEAGKQAIARDDLSGLIDACFALLRLLPEAPSMPAAILSHVA